MLKRRRPTDGRAGLKGAIPTRFIVPEREDGPGRPVAIERRPQSANSTLESIKASWASSDDPVDLALELEDTCGEIRLQRVLRLPSPAGQNGTALATEGAQQAVQHTKGKPQAAATSGTAIQEHGPMLRANHLLRQSPIHPKIGIAAGNDIRIEAGKTDRHRLGQKPVPRPIRISGSQ
ncbi:MAG: hypothetical protein RLQ73_28830 [Hoeflea sp. D1-CHI-28]